MGSRVRLGEIIGSVCTPNPRTRRGDGERGPALPLSVCVCMHVCARLAVWAVQRGGRVRTTCPPHLHQAGKGAPRTHLSPLWASAPPFLCKRPLSQDPEGHRKAVMWKKRGGREGRDGKAGTIHTAEKWNVGLGMQDWTSWWTQPCIFLPLPSPPIFGLRFCPAFLGSVSQMSLVTTNALASLLTN